MEKFSRFNWQITTSTLLHFVLLAFHSQSEKQCKQNQYLSWETCRLYQKNSYCPSDPRVLTRRLVPMQWIQKQQNRLDRFIFTDQRNVETKEIICSNNLKCLSFGTLQWTEVMVGAVPHPSAIFNNQIRLVTFSNAPRELWLSWAVAGRRRMITNSGLIRTKEVSAIWVKIITWSSLKRSLPDQMVMGFLKHLQKANCGPGLEITTSCNYDPRNTNQPASSCDFYWWWR